MPRFYPIVLSLVSLPLRKTGAGHHHFIKPLLTPRHLFSTTSHRPVNHHYTKTSTHNEQHDHGYRYYEQVTENTVLSSFPRPNLNTTLHYTLFSTTTLDPASSNSNATKKKCTHCRGPHLSENCPC